MRILASRLSTHLCRRRSGYVQSRNFSSRNVKDEIFIKHRRVRWFVNSVTATYLVYLFGLPFMGDNLKMRHAMLLLESNFPFVKAVGAHKVARFATDDERRMNIVEIGGAQELVYMLGDAEDYYTRIEALKALAALSGSDEAAGALYRAGAISVIKSTPRSSDGAILFLGSTPESFEAEIEKYKSSLLKRFQDLRYDIPS